jgi:tubulin monoglycylase TTLL3/8
VFVPGKKFKAKQMVNHFGKTRCLTTKTGITESLKSMVWYNEDHREFYPRCFDLTKDEDLEDFMHDFKVTYA